MKHYIKSIILIITFLILGQACTSNPISPDKTKEISVNTSNLEQGTPISNSSESIPSIKQLAFQPESSLCQEEQADSAFNLGCKDSVLTIHETENRRGIDILLQRKIPVDFSLPFVIEITATSISADKNQMDENQYGLLFVDADGNEYAIRFQGQYFNLETWNRISDTEVKATTLFNMSYSPYLKTGGESNLIQISCNNGICDLFINSSFTGRFPIPMNTALSEVGFFTASDWDEDFGQVIFEDFTVQEVLDTTFQTEFFTIEDALNIESDTFSQSALSGAFNDFSNDGFHFSPLIPYGYYAAKANPSLADVAVSAVVHMEIDPSSSSSRYAGLVCRSSQDGMYMAVIRADGSYSIFRDTTTHPFALLAEKQSDAILSGQTDNTLRLECVGDQINFYINGTQVEVLTDSRYGIKFGRSGLFTKAGGEPSPDAVVFKDLMIEEIRE